MFVCFVCWVICFQVASILAAYLRNVVARVLRMVVRTNGTMLFKKEGKNMLGRRKVHLNAPKTLKDRGT